MFIKHSLIERIHTDVDIYVTNDGVTVIWQDNGDIEHFDEFKSRHDAWRTAYSVYRYERRLHPDWVVALVY